MRISTRGGVLAAALLFFSAAVMAEGYQVNTISSRQLGMGHTGFALKLGAESQFFNPAGMAFMESRVEASGSFNAISPTAYARIGGKEYKTDNDVSTPFGVFGAYRILDNLKAGIGVYTPAGSSINWTDNWPGATLNQSVKLAAFTVQPTLSWRVLPGLSVGAGLTMTWGTVNLHKGLITGTQLDGMLGAMGSDVRFGEITPASVVLDGKAGVAFGVNLGAMYDISEHVTAGVNFRSKSMLKVKAGKTEVSYATSDPVILGLLSSKLDGISKTEFSAEMPCPAVFGFGGAWHNDRVTATVDAQFTFWSAYKNLDISFKGASQFDQHLEKNYHDSWLLKGGVEWKLTPRFDVRAGLAVDFSPCDKEYYNPETPGMTKIEPTVGFTFRPLPNLGINAGFMYIAGTGEDNASYTSVNILTGQPETFTADYRLHALVGSIGVSLSF
ncbi:MAG: outer membrane protein transport protein [Muribaculaceae bacterium]|nr:outer membrane protein transport protein [Muribaculaceae bacterium]